MWEALGTSEWKVEGSEARDDVRKELTGQILLVDDDPHFLRILGRILSGENFRVTSTSVACEAIKLFQDHRFDLVICDLRMPDCDGLDVLQEVRRINSQVPVIILTAYGEVDTYLEAMNAGATEYLSKPIKSEELLRVVRTYLYNSRPS